MFQWEKKWIQTRKDWKKAAVAARKVPGLLSWREKRQKGTKSALLPPEQPRLWVPEAEKRYRRAVYGKCAIGLVSVVYHPRVFAYRSLSVPIGHWSLRNLYILKRLLKKPVTDKDR